jgi:hypothetical protein
MKCKQDTSAMGSCIAQTAFEQSGTTRKLDLSFSHQRRSHINPSTPSKNSFSLIGSFK